MSDPKNNAGNDEELLKILEEFRDSKNKQQTGNAEADDVDEAIGIISARQNDDVRNEAEADAELEIPESIFSHLSDEGGQADDDTAFAGNPHFTESFTAVPSPEEKADGDDTDDEEDCEPESGWSKAGRVLQKLSLLPKAVIYIAVVVILSAYLSYYIISIGNDVFALVTDEREVQIEIAEGATDDDVAKLLEESGIIEYGWVYKLYMRYRGSGDASTEYIPGTYTLNTNYNYSQIITRITTKTVNREVVRITIPEGFTVDQIIDLFVSNGLGEREKYVEAINEYPYKHEFVQALEEAGYPETRKYRLEGYLFPDTYDFYNTTSEVYVINTLLNNFNNKFWKDFIAENSEGESYRQMMLEEYGMTFDDIVTLASMVQSEGKTAEDFEYISYVFHNRMSHSGTFPYLESDATIQYVLEERESDSSKIDISIDSPYNTYNHEGLPPGAISNPGLDAFTAAMFPSAPLSSSDKEIDAYFFVSNNAGKTYYASGRSGHEKNVAQVEKDNAAIEAGAYEG